MTIKMDNSVSELAKARQNIEDVKFTADNLMEAMYATPEGKAYLEAKTNLEAARTAEKEADAWIRELALQEYAEIPNKNLHDRVTIKINTSVDVPDEKIAVMWCLHNFTPALSLNRKVFDAAVKAGTISDGIAKVVEKPTVNIASDLSDYLDLYGCS